MDEDQKLLRTKDGETDEQDLEGLIGEKWRI